MVRFARADGSKGSNKRQLEEPTPWTEMVAHLESKKKRKLIKKDESGKNDKPPGQGIKENDIGPGEQETGLQNAVQVMKNQKTGVRKEEHPLQTQNTAKNDKKKRKKGEKTSEPEYTITPEGKRVKVFRDGTERTWFDLPYEESDVMTRYESMWVKKEVVEKLDLLKATLQEEGLDKKEIMKKMMKAKRKAHRELRIELIYQQKSLVNEAAGEEGDLPAPKRINGKKKKKATKSSKNKRQNPLVDNQNISNPVDENDAEEMVQAEEEQIDSAREKKTDTDSTDGKIQKENKMEVSELDVTSSQVNGKDNEGGPDDKNVTSTSQDNIKVKKKNKSKKDILEAEVIPTHSNREDNDEDDKELAVTAQTDGKKKNKKKNRQEGRLQTEQAESQIDLEDKMKKKNIQENRLETELAKSQTDLEDNKEGIETEVSESFTNKTDNTSSSQEGFEENEIMTNFDGYWVLREEVENLEADKKRELEAIYAARPDWSETSNRELTQQEQLVLQRAMKKKKRFHHRKLLKKLSSMGQKVSGDGKKKGKEKGGGKKDDDSGKVVKFDGFWVKKEAADRLHKLRKKFYSEGLSQQEVDALIQKERRKEERVLKNERKLVCLNCRQPGHMVSACPNIVQAEGGGQPSICYTCGSTEHTSSSCNLKKGSEKSFSFATCYICGEAGHISRQCPDNPRGLYPKGGACRGCGSVEHLAKDCPDLQKEKEESSIRVGRLKGEELEALDADEDEGGDQDGSTRHYKLDKPKVVKF